VRFLGLKTGNYPTSPKSHRSRSRMRPPHAVSAVCADVACGMCGRRMRQLRRRANMYRGERDHCGCRMRQLRLPHAITAGDACDMRDMLRCQRLPHAITAGDACVNRDMLRCQRLPHAVSAIPAVVACDICGMCGCRMRQLGRRITSHAATASVASQV